ncbi:MAG: LapD/MoxY N-terminal periplasmic domain-containing protein [Gammaproteobacteria bacterium]
MTLFKQVALLVSMVFLLIVITITAASLDQYGTIVRGQLQSSAQDMATTLGIAISNSSFGSDQPAYETLFNAVFDSGYYSSIELVAPDGELIHKKDRQLEVEGVPEWFLSLVPITPATATTLVMQGWSPLGTLKITLHPGYVYYGLFNNFESTLTWFSVLFFLGMMILWLLLQQLLKPLIKVREQADAIHSNKFVKQSSVPRTVELRTVVNAMNRMVDKVHTIFDDQEETLARYQKVLYQDPLTGLGNRRYFMSRLENAHSEESTFHSHMAVVKLLNIEMVHEQFGYEQADKAVVRLANILRELTGQIDNCYCARLANDEFALLVPANEQAVAEYIEDVFERFRSSDSIHDVLDKISLIAGVSTVHIGHDIGKTLADTDFALAQAETNGPYSVKEASSTSLVLPQGKMQWRNWLEDCIHKNRFFLVKQKAMNISGSAIHQEVFVRLRNDDNQIVPAALFMPMANTLNMGEAVDRVVFQLVKEICGRYCEVPVALNLTASVFSHADALVEFNQLLTYSQQSGVGLCVEASHTILEKYPVMCAEVAESVRKAGHVFGIDNLNPGRSLHDLKIVRPDYLKVNAQTLYDMSREQIAAGYQALQTMTRTMDIELIAVAVDSQQIHDHLQQLGIDAMQGNLLGEPEEFV